jgi:protein phosphatase
MAQASSPNMYFGSRTDVGCQRERNEDSLVVSPPLFAVADGMGGHKAGDLASLEAVRFFVRDIREHSTQADDVVLLMKTTLERTNKYVYYMAQESPDYRGMGTTFVAATIIGRKLYCLNVGDSRLYVVNRAGVSPVKLTKVTEDHSIVEMLVKRGMITEEEARNHPQKNMITRAIGIDERVEIDDFVVDTADLTQIMLCSDGLTNMVEDREILGLLTSGRKTDEKCRDLVDTANANGGKDNVSVIVIDIAGEDMSNA